MTQSLPPRPTAPARAPESRDWFVSPMVLGCVVLPALLLMLGVLGVAMGWRKFTSYGIATDFTSYQAKIRPMDLAPEVKKPLLDKLDRLREKARVSPMSFWRWIDYDESVKSMIDDGKLDPDEVEALNRELDRMEADLR